MQPKNIFTAANGMIVVVSPLGFYLSPSSTPILLDMLQYASRVRAMLPVANKELSIVAACSVVVLTSYFYAVQFALGRKAKSQTQRQKSWVLTAFSSAIMTSLSLPFVANWYGRGTLISGGRYAEYGCTFFVAYLLCDLAIGSMHYRSSISLLTGWIHHIVYILLITLVVIPYNFSSLFALCCILELPTFILAIGSLDAAYRNDYVFAAVIQHGFPMVRLARIDDAYFNVRHKEDGSVEVEEWPKGRTRYNLTEWLEWFECEHAEWRDPSEFL
ncbi:hypothetical protein NM688_g3774 [Phlebia brevispora]|uniref:Uncharacterized protein n=1 Tax=Phlebia brevispora TaxID=194682 RepID=A0ACC1T4S7_9APHY|nr:hypothetical protein NM688_g3774 [Phlebia brevispora]